MLSSAASLAQRPATVPPPGEVAALVRQAIAAKGGIVEISTSELSPLVTPAELMQKDVKIRDALAEAWKAGVSVQTLGAGEYSRTVTLKLKRA